MNTELIRTHLVERLPALDLLWRQPSDEQLNALANSIGCPVRFGTQNTPASARDYERTIATTQQVPTRTDSWHDRFNAAMWLLWPRSKQTLNRAHIAELDNSGGNQTRSRRRDALTLLDEVGIVVVATDSAIERLNAGHCWHRLFLEHRAEWGHSIRPLIIGHGLAEQLLNPYIGLTAKALHLVASSEVLALPAVEFDAKIDRQLAAVIESAMPDPGQLRPLPVLGIPGWHEKNQQTGFYDNRDYFRPKSA